MIQDENVEKRMILYPVNPVNPVKIPNLILSR